MTKDKTLMEEFHEECAYAHELQMREIEEWMYLLDEEHDEGQK